MLPLEPMDGFEPPLKEYESLVLPLDYIGAAACIKLSFLVLGSVAAGLNRKEKNMIAVSGWSWNRDLNPRPRTYKDLALPTELFQHVPD